jgi:4a-hydroxytetrahydrobiopterin dehydratase
MVSREVLSDTQIEKALESLDGWSRDGDAIRRDFEFSDFVAAVGFIAQIGVLAERANHHPELSNVYNKVGIALSSHDAGGVTERDINLAREINERA